MSDIIPSALKWHGGKFYLARRLRELTDRIPHKHRVDAFGGALTYTLAQDPEGVSEVAGDVHFRLTNFWEVMQRPKDFEELRRRLEATPFSSFEWEEACRVTIFEDPIEDARRFFVLVRQSLAGRISKPALAPLSKTRVRREMNEQVSAWLTAIEGLPAVHSRLKRVVIRLMDFRKLVAAEDGPETLFYFDPTYHPDCRTNGGGEYEHELKAKDHEDLLELCEGMAGSFLLSHYHHPLYDAAAERNGWDVDEIELPNNAAGGAGKRRMVECIFSNAVVL